LEALMKSGIALLTLISMMFLSSCTKKESAEAPKPAEEASKPAAETPAPAQPAGGPHAFVNLKSGDRVPGTIVASSKTDMVVAGDDGIEHKIPLSQIKSVDYGDTAPAAVRSSREPAPPKRLAKEEPATTARREEAPKAATQPRETAQPTTTEPLTPVPAPVRAVTTKTYELPVGSEISVRTNEAIDSETAAEGQTFDAQVTRDAKDANGDIVIPRGSRARVVIKSASKGGRFHGASDLVLDLQSVAINGKQYTIDTTDMTRKGKSGVGANKRTAEYTGGGAALGAIIGAIAGGGKGAAIGAGAGAGAGALTQILTKGRAIKVPVESVLTFNLDKSLKVTAAE
jgi:hypothetical protein